jgi:hypothetical protein
MTGVEIFFSYHETYVFARNQVIFLRFRDTGTLRVELPFVPTTCAAVSEPCMVGRIQDRNTLLALWR